MTHDISPVSGCCVACGVPADLSHLPCEPSTDDSPEGVAEHVARVANARMVMGRDASDEIRRALAEMRRLHGGANADP